MGNALAAGIEEHQITGLQVGFGDLASQLIVLRTAGSRDADTVFVVHILHKTAAIKALGSRTAPQIGNTDVFFRGRNNLRCQAGAG